MNVTTDLLIKKKENQKRKLKSRYLTKEKIHDEIDHL